MLEKLFKRKPAFDQARYDDAFRAAHTIATLQSQLRFARDSRRFERERKEVFRGALKHLKGKMRYSSDERLRACARKTSYAKIEDAELVALTHSNDTKQMGVYKCKFCSTYHLATKRD